jgi:hypothetical protein
MLWLFIFSIALIRKQNAPNMRLQPTAQLAAKKHASSLASLAMPAHKWRIIQAFLAPALLGAPEALAVG